MGRLSAVRKNNAGPQITKLPFTSGFVFLFVKRIF